MLSTTTETLPCDLPHLSAEPQHTFSEDAERGLDFSLREARALSTPAQSYSASKVEVALADARTI
jgi:hypothetical protein